MSQRYEVVLMSPKEFEHISRSDPRYAHVDETNVGFTDPVKHKAYVLNTHWDALNRYLVSHEFEHLLEEEGTHEDEYGVRHKKFFKQAVLPALGGLVGLGLGGPVGAGLGAGLGSFAGNKLSGVPTGQSLGTAALTGLGAGVGGVALGGLGRGSLGTPASAIATTTKATQPALKTIGSQVPSALARFGTRLALGGPGFAPGEKTFPQIPAPFPPGSQPGPRSSLDFFQRLAGSIFTGGGGQGGGGFNLPSLLAGGALLGIGQTAGPKTPEVPPFSQVPSVAQLRQTAGQPQSALGRLAQTRLSERLTQTQPTLDPAIESNIRRVFNEERNQTTSQFKLYRPGANLAEDSAFRQAMADVDQRESESLAQARQQEIQRFQVQQAEDISQALGVDTQTLQTLGALAQLDIEEIMLRMGLDAQRASEFKQQFGRIAELFLSRGLNTFQLVA